MKIFNTLQFRFIFFFILFIIALTMTLIIMGVRLLSQTVIDTFAVQGIHIVERAASLINGDKFEALSKSLDIEDPFYEETREMLHHLKESSGCIYLYTMALKSGAIWRYIVDGSALPGDENFSMLGDEEDTADFDDAFRKVLISGETEISHLVDQGEWGWLISVYTPIKNSSGTTVGIIGIDFDGEELYQAILSSKIKQITIGVISIIFGIILLVFIMRLIFKPIKEINGILKEISMGEGDLTKRINLDNKNEIGELADSFNKTLEKISRLIISIINETKTLSDTGNDLSTNMSETAAAIDQITSNIQSIQRQILNQSASVSETNATMEQVVTNINKLNGHIENQSSNISSASSAIEEMAVNTKSVADTLIRNEANVRVLKNAAELGRSGLQEVAEDIQKIAIESEGLLDINSVMEDIASQTNLLSMNAAIEAAHAGEAGRGFAVVAGEIRKLAENSSKQSKTIGTVLKKIKNAIDKIKNSTGDVLNKFESIDTGVNTVVQQENSIRSSIEEQQSGSRQLLQGIGNVNEITRHVQSGSHEMLVGANEVINESVNLEKVTQEITMGMSEMAAGANQINVAINHVKEITRKNRENISMLVNEVSRFKVE